MPLTISKDLLTSITEGTYAESVFDVFLEDEDITELFEDQLDESIFAGMPSTVIKALTQQRAGAGSTVTQDVTKNKSRLRAAINDALKGGSGVVILKGTRMIASMVPQYADQKEFGVYDEYGVLQSHEETKWYSRRIDGHLHTYSQKTTVRSYTKGKAIEQLIDKVEQQGGFSEDITVKGFKIDQARLDKQAERRELKKGIGGRAGLAQNTYQAAERLVNSYIQKDYTKTINDSVNITKQIVEHIKTENLEQMLFEAKKLVALLEKEINSNDYREVSRLASVIATDAEDMRTLGSGWSKERFIANLRKLKEKVKEQ